MGEEHLYCSNEKASLNNIKKVGAYSGHIRGRDYREERRYKHPNGMQVLAVFLNII